MRRSVILALVSLVAFTTNLVRAQNTSSAVNSERKITSRVAPNYPELAKKMHIHGVVNMEAIARPNGTVHSTRVLGGNPVLVDSAVEAVSKWKCEVAQDENTAVVQLTFEGQ